MRLLLNLYFAFLFAFSCVLGKPVQQRPPTCAPTDYSIYESTPCTNGLRTVTYTLRPMEEYLCEGPPSLVLANQSCECDLYEYGPEGSACNAWDRKGGRKISGWNATNGQCKANPEAVRQLNLRLDGNTSWVPCDCRKEDIASRYTECDRASNTRNVVFFWKRHCSQTGRVMLPRTSVIGCDDACDDGQFLGPPNTRCTNCSAGTYSVAGDVYAAPFLEGIPHAFHQDCQGSGCRPWRILDGVIETNEQPNFVATTLTFYADVVTAPSFLFVTYKISTEFNNDFFQVFLNDKQVGIGSGIMKDWKSFQIDLQSLGRDCKWHIEVPSDRTGNLTNLCLIANALEPYTPDVHFNTSRSPYTFRVAVAANSGCHASDFSPNSTGRLVLIMRGICPFADKLRLANFAGASAIVVVDHVESQPILYHMSGSSIGNRVPSMSMGNHDGRRLINALVSNPDLSINVVAEDVNIGRQKISFRYSKNRAGSGGEDKVFIKEIIVTGTKYAADTCTPCRPGYSSTDKSTECQPCPADTYAPTSGFAYCVPCPPHTQSPAGSAFCIPNNECSAWDYKLGFGKCVKGGQSPPVVGYYQDVDYIRIKTLKCNHNASRYQPPANMTNLRCQPCALGSQRDEVDGMCKPCSVGTYSNLSTMPCAPCASTRMALRVLQYNGFADLNGVFPPTWNVQTSWLGGDIDTSDDITLGNATWIIAPAGDSALPPANNLSPNTWIVTRDTGARTALLIIPLTIENARVNQVEFSYHFVMHPNAKDEEKEWRGLNIIAVMDGHTYILDKNATASKPRTLFIPKVSSPGDYKLHFIYFKTSYTLFNVSFVLRSLRVEGEAHGGATSCEECPPGHVCTNSLATLCPEGTFSEDNVCKRCPAATVAQMPGQSKCVFCPEGTTSTVTQDQCSIPSSQWRVASYRYANVSFLGQRYGPISALNLSTGRPMSDQLAIDSQFYAYFNQDLSKNNTKMWTSCGMMGATATYLCQRDSTAKTTFLGRLIENVTVDGMNVVTITMGGGDACSVIPGQSYVATIRLICSLFHEEPTPTMRLVGWQDCTAVFEMYTQHACPTCDSVPQQRIVSACEAGGKRQVSYITNTTCQGDQVLQAMEDCTDLEKILEHHDQAFVWAIVLGSIGVIALLGVALRLYVTKRRIYGAYSRLATSAPAEMDDFGNPREGAGVAQYDDAEYVNDIED